MLPQTAYGSSICVLEKLHLVVQEELGKGVDRIDGFEGYSCIFSPQQVWAKNYCQIGIGHLVDITVGRDLHVK